ncbi:DUF3962 domain-containing protein [Nocardiopsis sp. HUAS JQ3]|uniref:pPIWI_RE module domain-containing protein n=1 Tax=Nocardiopsis sp. HUAS JQ3 TaxID=3061629 RepID=UPI0023A9E88C|nr:DUF3962 domain-containing protein [Nocardiopsis sp. HUAS JQ3]WDZ92269.1 DUF3962 domain-containing protein [Nocardiopsis sp. HUAS JQ3]
MAYQEIHTAAFVPADGLDTLSTKLHTLTFPEHWRQAVLDFYAQTRSEKGRSKVLEHQSVPITRLNHLLRAVAPGLVSVGRWAPTNTDQPWLYSEKEFSPQALMKYISAWLEDMAPKEKGTKQAVAESFRPMLTTLRTMDPATLTWNRTPIELLRGTVSEGGTLLPDSSLYRLLPEYAASRVVASDPYRFAGEEVHWHRAAGYEEAELLSDVLSYTPKGRDHTGKPWYYSGYLRFYLRTEPFSTVPRLHVETGIRRWTSGKANLQGTTGASAYLRADATLLPEAPTPDRLAVAYLQWDPRTERPEWRMGGPMDMLKKLAITDKFPDPESLAKEGTQWLTVGQGPQFALTHHTTMGTHRVGSGIMPEERRRLMEWVAAALEPEFVAAPALVRAKPPKGTVVIDRVLKKTKKVTGTEAKKAVLAEENRRIESRNAQRRRAHLAEVLKGADLSAMVLYQNSGIRDQMIQAAEDSLDLTDHRVDRGPETWVWRAPDLTVRLTARLAGEITGPLGGTAAPKRGNEFEEEAAKRRNLVKDTVQGILAKSGVDAQVAYVELDGVKTSTGKRIFGPTQDPKGAIRAGAARARIVSQFAKPYDPQDPPEVQEENARHRIESAWSDGLRQLGATFVPRAAEGGAVPVNLTQIAFWMVRRNVAGKSSFSQFTPIALLSRGKGQIMGCSPETQGWVSYRDLLCDLTGQIESPRTEQDQTAAVASFVRTTLQPYKFTDTLVLLHAQNARHRWPWLGNAGLLQDRIKLGHGPEQRLPGLGRRMRVIRVASSERAEVPQWWAPAEGKDAGFTEGLWRTEDDTSGRVFYSTGRKPSTAQTHKGVAKLTSHTIETGEFTESGIPKVRDLHVPSAEARTPQLMQLTLAGLLPDDDPVAWARFVHEQRDGDDYREHLALPVLLHLASKANEYAIPYEETEEDEVLEDGETGQMTLF